MKPINNKQLNEKYDVSLKGGTRVNQLKNPEKGVGYGDEQMQNFPGKDDKVVPKMPNRM